jgi:hypothetical protein
VIAMNSDCADRTQCHAIHVRGLFAIL